MSAKRAGRVRQSEPDRRAPYVRAAAALFVLGRRWLDRCAPSAPVALSILSRPIVMTHVDLPNSCWRAERSRAVPNSGAGVATPPRDETTPVLARPRAMPNRSGVSSPSTLTLIHSVTTEVSRCRLPILPKLETSTM